jgi:hypothetical protein
MKSVSPAHYGTVIGKAVTIHCAASQKQTNPEVERNLRALMLSGCGKCCASR